MSGYVKVLEGFIRLFPKKIKVTFIHESGYNIGICKINSDRLPGEFKRPVIIEAFDRRWRVINTVGGENGDYLYTKKLTLEVVEAELVDEMKHGYFKPTIASEMPELVNNNEFEETILELTADNWRQIELLSADIFSTVKEEMEIIQSIRKPGKGVKILSGYNKRYLREKIGAGSNDIQFEELCKLINVQRKGAIQFNSDGFVKDGFAVQTDSYIYYGRIQGQVIKDLCIYEFDCADDEIFTVLTKLGLIIADWCKGKILTAEVAEVGQDIEL